MCGGSKRLRDHTCCMPASAGGVPAETEIAGQVEDVPLQH